MKRSNPSLRWDEYIEVPIPTAFQPKGSSRLERHYRMVIDFVETALRGRSNVAR